VAAHTSQVIAASARTTSDWDRSLEPKFSAEQRLRLRLPFAPVRKIAYDVEISNSNTVKGIAQVKILWCLHT
jgi:hypothetical protein